MDKAIDLRIVKTQKLIKTTFLELMNEMGFQKINVRNLVERAEINRSTFYLHYSDKFDLLNTLENELFADMKKIILDFQSDRTDRDTGIDKLVDIRLLLAKYIYENKHIFTLLTGPKGDSAFISKFVDVMKVEFFRDNLIKRPSLLQKYEVAAATGMMVSLLNEWLINGLQETPEEYVEIASQIEKGLIENILNM